MTSPHTCCTCLAPSVPAVQTSRGRAHICRECFEIVDPTGDYDASLKLASRPDAEPCTCGVGCKPGTCSDERHDDDAQHDARRARED